MTVTDPESQTSVTITLWTTDDFVYESQFRHPNRVFITPESMIGSDIDQSYRSVASYFMSRLNSYLDTREPAIERMVQAILGECSTDPRYNYDKFEDGGWSDTHEIDERTTRSTNTPGVVRTAENYTAGYDSSTPALAGKTVDTPDATHPDQIETTSNIATGTGPVTDVDTRLFNAYHVYGNIGTMTSTDMADKIMQLYGHLNIGLDILKECIDYLTVYIDAEEVIGGDS